MPFYLKSPVTGAILILLALPLPTYCQDKIQSFTAKNALYFEVGGVSGIYALSYGRIFRQNEKIKMNVSVGFSMWPNETFTKTTWLPALPLELTAFYGKANHHLEVGLGFTSFLERFEEVNSITLELDDAVYFGAAIPLRFGYRYQKPGGGFFYRVAYTPFILLATGRMENWTFNPIMGGISVGKSF